MSNGQGKDSKVFIILINYPLKVILTYYYFLDIQTLPTHLDDEYISVGGWKINVRSIVDVNATTDDVITGHNKLSMKLKLEVRRTFLPFIARLLSLFWYSD